MGGTQGFGATSAYAERAALKINTGPVLANDAPGHGGTDVPLTEMKTTDSGRVVNSVQDDFVVSFASEQEAYDINKEVTRVHGLAHFELRGFVSDSPTVQRSLNTEDDNEVQTAVQLDNTAVDKILGMFWKKLHQAELILCKVVQAQTFEEEISVLTLRGLISKSSAIYSLSPELNGHGVLVVHGRLDYATVLPQRARQPIILPKGHGLTNLIVQHYHEIYHHQNDELIVN
ncbi:hypothetical protein ACLKA7_001433 [Drosophila subpalustris]